MAGYTNGQNYYGLPNDKPPSHPLQHPAYPPQPAYGAYGAARPSSFDAGDDATSLNDRQFQDNHGSAAASGFPYPAYRTTNSQTSQHPQVPQIDNQARLPMRMPSRVVPGPGYVSQVQIPPQAISQSSYNPSQYPQPQSQNYYSPQTYGSPTSLQGSPAYQAYNPAAYQPTTAQSYPTQYYSQPHSYESYTQPYAPAQTSATEPPPPPPRHRGSLYGSQNAPHGNYIDDAYRTNNSLSSVSSALPLQPATYSPSAPPHDPYMAGYRNSQPTGPFSYTLPHSPEVLNVSASQPPPVERLSSESGHLYEAQQSSFAHRVSPEAATQYHDLPSSAPWANSQQPPPVMPHRAGTVGRHPQSRPLPGTPADSYASNHGFRDQNGTHDAPARIRDGIGYDELMREVDAAIQEGSDDSNSAGPNLQNFQTNSRETTSTTQGQASPLSISPHLPLSPDERPTHMNGGFRLTEGQDPNYAALSDESDAEAAAGLAAMQAAEQQEAAEAARHRSDSTSFRITHNSHGDHAFQRQEPERVGNNDYPDVDTGVVRGGYEAARSFSDEPQSDYATAAAITHQDHHQSAHLRAESMRSPDPSSNALSSHNSGYDSIPGQDAIHPFPPFGHVDLARVDTGGTGGLIEPSPHPRRLSFEDGDEATMAESETGQTSESVSPSRDGMRELFFFPEPSPQRPLPPPPSCSDPGRIPHLIPAGTLPPIPSSRPGPNGRPYPSFPTSYASSILSPSEIGRSTSLTSVRSRPQTEQPIRSKTDADRAKILRQQQLGGRPDSEIYEPALPGGNVLDLPNLPRKKFNPSKLTKDQLKMCSEPWALSSLVAWIRDLAEEETDLKQQAIVQAAIALFTFAVPTMNMADAEALADQVVNEMFSVDALVKEEEWVKFGNGTVSGVLFQLTKKGCYSCILHESEMPGKCYSYHCMRTLRKVDLSLPANSEKHSEDWMTFYQLKMDALSGRDKKEIERQNVLHEIVGTEVAYIESLNIVRILYRDTLTQSQPPIIPSKRMANFCRDVFGKVDEVKRVNEDYLLAQLKYRQREQGPWITGFSDIFREWIRKAKSSYIEYATGFPLANFLVRKEASKNLLFKQLLDQARDDPRSNRLSWDTYLKSPITRLQRYSLLLTTVLKSTTRDSEEKLKLQFAIDEIKAATHECNVKVAEMERKMDLLELRDKLRLRRGMEKEVGLNLDHLGREIIWQGDLLRAGGKGFQWVDTHAILFDHYLVLAKAVARRDSGAGAKCDYYDVSKVPIPMDLIILESTNDEPVVKGSVKSIGGIGSMAATPRSAAESRISRTTSTISGASAPASMIAPSGASMKDSSSTSKTIATSTVLDSNSKDEKIIYPFKVKHLGKSEIYTLYAPTKFNRDEWCQAISSAKNRHSAALFQQNAEPFRLRVLADTAFGYDALAGSYRPTVIKEAPLDRAITEVERKYGGRSLPSPICRATVNCATAFNHPPGRSMCAVGTDYGVFFSEYNDPRGWSRAINMTRVVQVAVFEEFNLFLLISDKALIAYHLDAVCPPSGAAPAASDASARRAPQKLSGNKDVGFFATGRMKDRALVFYKKKDGINSTFKVLEPILQKAGGTRSRFLPTPARRGQTDFFREFDEFYIPTECYSINLFHSSLAVATTRGIEVLTLDKKMPWSVPTLHGAQADTQPHLSSIASRIKDLKPLGMFRLSEVEFLVAFEECAVYVNKHGDVSRGVVMEFVGKATTACLYGQHLILFVHDFVEIRNAMNGSLKQVIAGKDIKMLDDGGGSNGIRAPNGGLGGGINGLGVQGYGATPRTVKISMQHPGHDRNVVIVELLQNEGARE